MVDGTEQSPEIDPHIYGQKTFVQDSKSIQWRRNDILNKWCWNNWISIQNNKYQHLMLHIKYMQYMSYTIYKDELKMEYHKTKCKASIKIVKNLNSSPTKTNGCQISTWTSLGSTEIQVKITVRYHYTEWLI